MAYGWTVRHDRAATAADYRGAERGATGYCDCSSCRNFALQRSTMFPAEFLRLLEKLGVDASKERGVYDPGPAGNGLRCYVCYFGFVGGSTSPEAGTAPERTRFSFDLTDHPDLLGSEACASESFVEFDVPMPWLLANNGAD